MHEENKTTSPPVTNSSPPPIESKQIRKKSSSKPSKAITIIYEKTKPITTNFTISTNNCNTSTKYSTIKKPTRREISK